jgi:hypothetical protein
MVDGKGGNLKPSTIINPEGEALPAPLNSVTSSASTTPPFRFFVSTREVLFRCIAIEMPSSRTVPIFYESAWK